MLGGGYTSHGYQVVIGSSEDGNTCPILQMCLIKTKDNYNVDSSQNMRVVKLPKRQPYPAQPAEVPSNQSIPHVNQSYQFHQPQGDEQHNDQHQQNHYQKNRHQQNLQNIFMNYK